MVGWQRLLMLMLMVFQSYHWMTYSRNIIQNSILQDEACFVIDTNCPSPPEGAPARFLVTNGTPYRYRRRVWSEIYKHFIIIQICQIRDSGTCLRIKSVSRSDCYKMGIKFLWPWGTYAYAYQSIIDWIVVLAFEQPALKLTIKTGFVCLIYNRKSVC